MERRLGCDITTELNERTGQTIIEGEVRVGARRASPEGGRAGPKCGYEWVGLWNSSVLVLRLAQPPVMDFALGDRYYEVHTAGSLAGTYILWWGEIKTNLLRTKSKDVGSVFSIHGTSALRAARPIRPTSVAVSSLGKTESSTLVQVLRTLRSKYGPHTDDTVQCLSQLARGDG